MQLLGTLGIGEDVITQRFLAAILQPFVDGQAVALRLGNLLTLGIKEQLVNQAFGLVPAEHAGDFARLNAAVGQILAIHLVIDAQRDPAHRPIDLPLALGHAAQGGLFDGVAVLIGEADNPGGGVHHGNRHLQHRAGGWRNRHDRRIGLTAFFAQGRQHDVHYRAKIGEHTLERVIEPARIVTIRRADELIFKPELVEEFAQHRVVVRGKTFVFGAKRIGNAA